MKLECEINGQLQLKLVPKHGLLRHLYPYLFFPSTHFYAFVSSWWELYVGGASAPNEWTPRFEVNSEFWLICLFVVNSFVPLYSV